MSDTEHNQETFEHEAPIESLGVRLRTAREHRDLSIETVAHQLNLNPQRVVDMENDDYRFSNAETYAKGYLRAYAKLLGLDPNGLVHDFDRLHFTETIERREPKLIIKRQACSSDRWIRWVTYGLATVLIFLVAIWWRSQPSTPAETETLVKNTPEQLPIKIDNVDHAESQTTDLTDVLPAAGDKQTDGATAPVALPLDQEHTKTAPDQPQGEVSSSTINSSADANKLTSDTQKRQNYPHLSKCRSRNFLQK